MKTITFRGSEFHVADTERELNKLLFNKFGYNVNKSKHHAFGRVGILALCIENIIIIDNWVHIMQKSGDPDQRDAFNLMVKSEMGCELWDKLKELSDYIKNVNPLFGKTVNAK